MKAIVAAAALMAMTQMSAAGGMPEPQMEPAVIEADTAASANHDWVGVVMILMVAATAVTN